MSVRGIAREVAALNGERLKAPTRAPVAAKIDAHFPVKLSASDGCPKFVGRVIRGLDARASSPLWLRERLRRSGLRAINPIVDVTNYVMLELGTPMHAYDLACLEGGIDVRRARANEKLTLLDGAELALHAEDLVIADAGRSRGTRRGHGRKAQRRERGNAGDLSRDCVLCAAAHQRKRASPRPDHGCGAAIRARRRPARTGRVHRAGDRAPLADRRGPGGATYYRDRQRPHAGHTHGPAAQAPARTSAWRRGRG